MGGCQSGCEVRVVEKGVSEKGVRGRDIESDVERERLVTVRGGK
jgi:hypothetical protein